MVPLKSQGAAGLIWLQHSWSIWWPKFVISTQKAFKKSGTDFISTTLSTCKQESGDLNALGRSASVLTQAMPCPKPQPRTTQCRDPTEGSHRWKWRATENKREVSEERKWENCTTRDTNSDLTHWSQKADAFNLLNVIKMSPSSFYVRTHRSVRLRFTLLWDRVCLERVKAVLKPSYFLPFKMSQHWLNQCPPILHDLPMYHFQ